jgi:excinuclease UvrABC nuclease subunit
MKRQYLTKKKLPDSPGVYFFKNGKEILYIGKATSLRDRVKSYFSTDLIKTRGRLLVDMVTLSKTIDFIKTDSVLEAFMLESQEIKKHLPKYNTKEKDNKSFNYVVVTQEDFPQVLVRRGRNIEKEVSDVGYKYVFGPYPYGGELKEAMRLIRKIFPYRDDKCHPLQGRPCFNYSIGLCPGVCCGAMNKQEYGRTINHLRLFFQGKKSQLVTVLKKEMKAYAKEQKFEQANDIKRTLLALEHIQDISMIKKERFGVHTMRRELGFKGEVVPEDLGDVTMEPTDEEVKRHAYRLEAYDIAHLSGTDMIGVMTVMTDGEFDKAEYRTFIIKSVEKSNDTAALKEIIGRRLTHPEWPLPDLMIVDGGKAQLTTLKNAVNENAEIFGANDRALPVIVSVVKDEKHKARELFAEGEDEIVAEERAREIVELNAESHRFAIVTHRKKREASRGLKKRA